MAQMTDRILIHKATGFKGAMIVADQRQSDFEKGIISIVTDNGITFRAPVGEYTFVEAI